MALLLALGVASLGRLSALALPALVTVMGALNTLSFLVYGVEHAELEANPVNVLDASHALAVQNGWPGFLPALCLGVALAAAVALGIVIDRNRRHFGGLPAAVPQ